VAFRLAATSVVFKTPQHPQLRRGGGGTQSLQALRQYTHFRDYSNNLNQSQRCGPLESSCTGARSQHTAL